MLKTVYSALAVTALLAGTASFAADQTAAPVATNGALAAPVAASTQATPVKTEAKADVKTAHAVKAGKTKDAAAPSTEASATTSKK